MSESDLDLFAPEQFSRIAGVDEVGRGCLAGPVVAAAVILDPNRPIKGLRDSKKLSAKKRDELAQEIKEKALAWSVAAMGPEVIDKINILQATLEAMKAAVEKLPVEPDFVQVDGNKLPKWKWLSEAVVKGDDKVEWISAASIIAKTTRDAYMCKMAELYPQYGFEHHVGYGTAEHIKALKAYGPTPIHRKTFAPVREVIDGLSTDTK
ncbi:ribonuclease HII [Parasutterella secunda]|uniref:ribonuclease HII n=1 Tax=Parasutterella secunda TaxID=626947 RepID=UPI0021ABA7D2|nr:ribonuclease HII [Parasutterella secunda]MCR8921023.1 ribonuclease HII [Parasutterella secunda]HJI94146.1 ribonuclease HII [Sutterellaceae bacterium]